MGALQYHDVDRDGFITIEEFAQSFLQWSVVQYRLQAMRQFAAKARKPSKWLKAVAEVERDVLSTHFCEDASSCEAVDDLEEHVKRLRDGGKRVIASTAGGVSQMFEGGDDEEQMVMHDRETGQSERMAVKDIQAEL